MKRLRDIPRVSILIAIIILVVIPSYHAAAVSGCQSSQSPVWQVCGPMQAISGVNNQPSLIQATDGTLRLAWTHITLGVPTIYYSVELTNGTWTGNSSITNLPGRNQTPSLVQFSNGTVFLFWSYKPTTTGNFQIYYRYLKGSIWSPYTKLPLKTATTLNDTGPSAGLGKDGTIWLTWTRDDSTPTATTIHRWLMYETMNSTGWAKIGEQTITSSSDTNWNWEPSILIPNDGVPRIVFSKGPPLTGQINYISRQTAGWSQPIPLSNSNTTANDQFPSLVQDRNGTLWVFWTRYMNTNYALRGEYSWDNGATWRGETLLTAACSGCPDSEYSAAVQYNLDKNLWVFYSTNPGPTGFDLWALVTVSPISPVHHIAISKALGSYGVNASEIYSGGFHNPYAGISQSAIVQVSITLSNLGDFNETATVGLSMTNTTIYPLTSQTVPVAHGTSVIISFNWNTTGVRPARFGLSATATIPIQLVGNQGDNTLAKSSIVHLLPLGDVDQDGSVTLTDVSVLYYNYGFGCSAPGVCSPRYNPFADPAGHGTIDIVDVGIVSTNFDIFT